jgi:hypothetical protein
MISRLPFVMAALAALSGMTALGWSLRWHGPEPEAIVTVVRPASQAPASRVNRDSLSHVAVATAMFRERRSLSPVAFDPSAPQGAAAPPPQGPPKPAPELVGIAWGAEPVALLDGVPGMEGSRIMHRGDTAGGLRLRRITPGEVVVTGFDTTWVLRVRSFR